MRVPEAEVRRRSFGVRGWLIALAVVILIVLFSVRGLARFYTDYLWFQDIGFEKTWRGLLSAKVVPAVIFSAVFFVLMLVNLIVADRIAPRYRGTGPEDEIIERYRQYVAPYAGRIRVIVSLFFAIIMGSGVAQQWQSWILFSNSTNFHIKDPQFHKDIGFYVFRLPFEQFAAGWVFAALLVVLIVSAVFHYLNGGIRLQSPFQRVTPQVKVHLSVLLALMALTKTVQYYLAQFALTTSTRGAVNGATYTDVHAQLPAFRLLMLISIAAAVLFIINIWRRGWIFPIIAVGLWGFIAIVIGTIYPAVIQKVRVEPNELSLEQKYIGRNITATRNAFNIANVNPQTFNYDDTLSAADSTTSRGTLDNVRLYDPAEASEAFKVDQARSTAYELNDVDVDRYKIGSQSNTPTLIALRELGGQLPDNSWTSQHLVYTHGYGAVAAAANATGGDNKDQPAYVLANFPPTGDIQLDPKYSPVYFGEALPGYAVVKTKVAEQEITGSTTQPTAYSGSAGVKVSSTLRKAAFALRFNDWSFFVSSQVTSNSRVIYIRDVQSRLQTAAPFLQFDHDPYPVVVGGKILWVVDGYTTTNKYPYSQSIHPHLNLGDGQTSGLDQSFNYVRNSVKATVDAYDGTVKFYVTDSTDPIIRAYRKAFPDLFTDGSKIPPELRAHFRYPEDLFSAQTEQLSLYHITDPVQYFNKQDIWDITQKPEASNTAVTTPAGVPVDQSTGRNTTLAAGKNPADPLYLTMQLPDSSSPEFLLERSFTPRGKLGNLSSFIFARSDPEHYGQLVSYTVPAPDAFSAWKAASAIESDQFISGQFTLLDQGGSEVRKGDVQLLPIGNSVMYLRPIWLTSKNGQPYPRYKFIAAVVGQRAVLGYDINDATAALLSGGQTRLQRDVQGGRSITNIGQGGAGGTGGSTTTTTVPTTPGSTTAPPPPGNATAQQLLQQAQTEFGAADAALTAHDLGAYSTHIANAERLVAQAQSKLGGP